MHFAAAALKPLSLASFLGATFLTVDSLTEHFDAIKAFAVVLLGLVSWFLLDLKIRFERTQREHGAKLEAHGIDIAQLKADGNNRQSLLDRLIRALDQHMQDEHRYQLFAMPRLYELTKHMDLGEMPTLTPPRRLRDTGEIRREDLPDEGGN